MIDTFTRYGVCANCDTPIHEEGRSAIHDTGQYRCANNEGFAEFAVTDSANTIRDEAYEVGYESGSDKGWQDGRAEYARDLYRWLDKENRAGTPTDQIIEQLLDRLADE